MACCKKQKNNLSLRLVQGVGFLNELLILDSPNSDTVFLEYVYGGGQRNYRVGNYEYKAGGRYKYIEVYKVHEKEMLKMTNKGRKVFILAHESIQKIRETSEVVVNSKEENITDVDLDELPLITDEFSIEIVEETPEELIKEEKPKTKRTSKKE